MCEPTHSIVQFPDKDDFDNPTGSIIDAIPASYTMDMRPGGMVLCQRPDMIAWAKAKILSWYHFSKLGFGHSESIGLIAPGARHRLPPDTRYEAKWWNRTVRLDGHYNGKDYDQQLALDCAKQYANNVSIGNMTKLRQFLTTSLRQSERPEAYIWTFAEALNTKGRDTYAFQLKRLFDIGFLGRSCNVKMKSCLEAIIKVVMGFTRKRRLLVPEWADDNMIWQ